MSLHTDSVFEVLAHENLETEQALSRAIVAGKVRAQDQYGAFVGLAKSPEDKETRIALLEDRLRQLSTDIGQEYKTDAEAVHAAVLAGFKRACDNEHCDDDDCKGCDKTASLKQACDCKDGCDCDDCGKDCKHSSVKTAADVEDGDSYQSERVALPSNKTDGLDGPSPKIDKGNSGDEGGWNLKPIDVDSVRNRLETQNPGDIADYKSVDFDPDSPVRDRVDADTTMQPEHNDAPHTDTWTGTEGLADPVTSAVLASYRVVRLDA